MQRVSSSLRAVVAAVLIALGLLAMPAIAAAHTDLDYTLPGDGEQAVEPVAQITVAFDDPVTLVGAGFEVLTPAGDIVVPSVFSEDGAVYFLDVAPPLAGGTAAVRYEVAAADGHVLQGGFSFTVPAAPAGTVPPATAPPTPAPVATTGDVTGAGGEATSPTAPTSSAAPATTAPVVIAPAPTTAVAGDDDGGGSGLLIGVVAAVALAGIAFVVVRSRMSSPT